MRCLGCLEGGAKPPGRAGGQARCGLAAGDLLEAKRKGTCSRPERGDDRHLDGVGRRPCHHHPLDLGAPVRSEVWHEAADLRHDIISGPGDSLPDGPHSGQDLDCDLGELPRPCGGHTRARRPAHARRRPWHIRASRRPGPAHARCGRKRVLGRHRIGRRRIGRHRIGRHRIGRRRIGRAAQDRVAPRGAVRAVDLTVVGWRGIGDLDESQRRKVDRKQCFSLPDRGERASRQEPRAIRSVPVVPQADDISHGLRPAFQSPASGSLESSP